MFCISGSCGSFRWSRWSFASKFWYTDRMAVVLLAVLTPCLNLLVQVLINDCRPSFGFYNPITFGPKFQTFIQAFHALAAGVPVPFAFCALVVNAYARSPHRSGCQVGLTSIEWIVGMVNISGIAHIYIGGFRQSVWHYDERISDH